MIAPIMGLDERQECEIISDFVKSKKKIKCISCGMSLEYNNMDNLCGLFCYYCKNRIKI